MECEKGNTINYGRRYSVYPGIFMFLLLASFLVSCQQDVVYDKVQEIPGKSWSMNDTISFIIDIEDTVSPNDIYINLHHTSAYSYSNLYIFLASELPDGELYRDTLEFILADREGKWLGKGFSKLKFNTFQIGRSRIFSSPGKYVFKVQHAMRVEELDGIRDIGIKIRKPAL